MRGPLVRSVARTVSAALAGERRAFSRALEAPGAAQDAALRRIVKSLAETRYGRASSG